MMASPAGASCKTDLPDPELRALDVNADTDAGGTIARARALLAGTPAPDALHTAELDAIIADAFDTIGDDAQIHVFVAAGRAALGHRPADTATQQLMLRFALVEADTAENSAEISASLGRLAAAESTVDQGSLGYACLLLVRGRIEGRMGEHEAAARDGTRAYSMTSQLGHTDGKAEAAYQLAITYRRAGLHDDALGLIDEVIRYNTARHQESALSNALFTKAQILADSGQPAAALPVVRRSKEMAIRLRDDVGLAFDEAEECGELVRLGNDREAKDICLEAVRGLRATGRTDQVAGTEDRLARIDLMHAQPMAAVSRLARVLSNGGSDIPPVTQPMILRDYAEALSLVGRTVDAYGALRQSLELAGQAGERRRSLAVALLKAKAEADRYAHDRDALAHEVSIERARADSEKLARHLAILLAAAAVVSAAFLAYLLRTSRRQGREIRRQELVLRAVAENSPDALALLDATGAIRYSNRPLVPGTATTGAEPSIAEQIPPSGRAAFDAALSSLLKERRPVTLDIRIPAPDGQRHFELRGIPILVDGELIGATLRSSDVTEQRVLEREVLDVANRERTRLSTELHEGLGQALTGVSFDLGALATAVSRGKSDVGTLVSSAKEQVQRAIATTRQLARGMSPVQTHRGSLSTAIAALAADLAARTKSTLTYSFDPQEISVPGDVADQIYRIADEAVIDAIRHEGFQRIDIALRQTSTSLELQITSDTASAGEPADPPRDLSLRMMSYRARVVGGELRIVAAPEGGTRMEVTVPLTTQA